MHHPARLPLAACVALAFTADGAAEIITVDTTADRPDFDLQDGVCDADPVAAGPQVTLRAAVMHANAVAGTDEIVLPAGVYKLTIQGAFEDLGATGDLDVAEELILTGAGTAICFVDGKKAKDRIVDLHAVLTVSGVTFTRGRAPAGESGGAIRNTGTLAIAACAFVGNRATDGGAIGSSGQVVIVDTLFTGNKAKDDAGAIQQDAGTLTVDRATFSKNKAGGEGGAIETTGEAGAMASLTNVTFSKNKAQVEGGAISQEDGANVALTNCTFAGNTAPQGGAALSNADEDLGFNVTTTKNTIFGKHKQAACLGVLTSQGGNLDAGTSCGFGAGDLSATDPLLAKLAGNGGLTPTIALDPASPCIDAAVDAGSPATDQRGFARVDVDGVGTATADVGAYEFQGT
jgi:predicted outer membrane repeat protein